MTTEKQREGARNRAAGKAWQLACAAWLRDHGYPNAAYEIRHGSSDILGTGDLAVECTLEPWDGLWRKLGQARRDAEARGLVLACVWKKRRRQAGDMGSADPGEGWVAMTAEQFFPLVLAAQDGEGSADAYDRGYARGLLAGVASVAGGDVRAC